MSSNFKNMFSFVEEQFLKNPSKLAAVFYPEGNAEVYTRKEVYERVKSHQLGFKQKGLTTNSKVLFLSTISPDFYFSALALISMGATPVFIDPSLKRINGRIKTAKPDFILLNKKTNILKYFIHALWGKKNLKIEDLTVNLSQNTNFEVINREEGDPLIISYTTGSTGKPKAADRNFGISKAQHEVSMTHWTHEEEDVDLTFFPNILFQNLMSGVPTIVPKITFRNIHKLNFEKILQTSSKWKPTRLSAPPGYLNQICNARSTINFNQIITGGAPVGAYLCKKVAKKFPDSETHIIYGSTEAEPIAFVDMAAVKNTTGNSFLVGKKIPEIQIRFVDNENNFNDKNGEIVLSGPHVVKRYLGSNDDNVRFKIKDSEGSIWHKTGDIGLFDDNKNLYILGRKNRKIKLENKDYYTLSFEREIARVLGDEIRVAVLQKKSAIHLYLESPENISDKNLALDYLKKFPTANFKIHFIKHLPVDKRHHWKIEYDRL